MSRHDDQVSLKDMLSHAREAADLLGDARREELGRNRVLQLALTRLVEIVGEAANRVSLLTRQKNSKIPWDQIIGMRNRLERYGVKSCKSTLHILESAYGKISTNRISGCRLPRNRSWKC